MEGGLSWGQEKVRRSWGASPPSAIGGEGIGAGGDGVLARVARACVAPTGMCACVPASGSVRAAREPRRVAWRVAPSTPGARAQTCSLSPGLGTCVSRAGSGWD